MILQYHMIRGNEFPPLRANPSDAGLDLRWVPSEAAETTLAVRPGESVLIPTGSLVSLISGSFLLELV